MHKRISIDPQVCHGQACIKGTRIPVHQIVLMLANGDTIDDLLESYPTISREDILACLAYNDSLAEKQGSPVNTIRFLNQFTTGHGNYTAERAQLIGDLSLDEIVSEIKQDRQQV